MDTKLLVRATGLVDIMFCSFFCVFHPAFVDDCCAVNPPVWFCSPIKMNMAENYYSESDLIHCLYIPITLFYKTYFKPYYGR